MYIAYSTATLSAETAERFGLVSEVAPADRFDAAVEKICATILKAPQPAVLAIKEYARGVSMDIKGADRLRAQSARGDQLFE
jgi:enoyl-CoA hydratase/carnithine racemase